MKWLVHSEKSLYRDHWLNVGIADVELPNGERILHRVVHTPESAGAIVINGEREALLIWRHRFITNSWGFEIPMGKVEPGETPEQAAAREALEETEWRPGPLQPFLRLEPSNGVVDSVHHIYHSNSATYERRTGPRDFEAERVEWIKIDDFPRLIDGGCVVSASTVAVMLRVLAQADSFHEAAARQVSAHHEV
jgi:8-oxo-dGTP pyrophosphatase MutT (NUDIX family)